MKRFFAYLLLGAMIMLFSITPVGATHVPQERWAYEDINLTRGIPELYTPFFGNYDRAVGSSWNEPRSSSPHPGVDQDAPIGETVGALWGTARIIDNIDNGANGGKTQVIRYYNSTTGKTFYSVYFHLSDWVKPENYTPSLSDYTAKTGDTGAPGQPHLHSEILDYIAVTDYGNGTFSVDYGSRVGVDPKYHYKATYYSLSTRDKFTVFKYPSALTGTDGTKRIEIDGWDSDLNVQKGLEKVYIYYKVNGGGWQSGTMTGSNSDGSGTRYKKWSFVVPSYATTVDWFVIGRRYSTEEWVAFPAKRGHLGSSSTGIDPNAAVYDTYRLTW